MFDRFDDMMSKHTTYILNKDKTYSAVSMGEYIEWSIKFPDDRFIKQETLANGVYISTVFLPIDHAIMSDVPVLFETMIFSGGNRKEGIDLGETYDQLRYTSYTDAVEGHIKQVEFYTKKMNSLIDEYNKVTKNEKKK